MAARIIQLIVAVTLMLSVGFSGASSRLDSVPAQLQTYTHLSERAEAAAWSNGMPAPGQMLDVLVQLRTAPLALADSPNQAATIMQAQDAMAALITAHGGMVLGRLSTAAVALAVRVDSTHLAALRADPAVLAVLPISDYGMTQAAGGEPLSLSQLNNLIGTPEVLRLFANTGQGVDIAVVDSGIDYTHRKLGGPGTTNSYFQAYCGDPLLRPGDPACNPGLNPPADLFPNTKVRGGYDYLGDVWPNPDDRCFDGPVCIFPDRNPIDGSGHGTHVADIAAGIPLSADGSDGGVASGANLWAFKACNGDDALCEGTALLLAIDHALDLDGSNRGFCQTSSGQVCAPFDPADIIVLSVAYAYGQPEDALTLMADLASYYGSLVVAAAGNDGNVPYIVGTPASASASLAVAESVVLNPQDITVVAGDRILNTRLQAWSAPILRSAGGELRIGDGQSNNLNGCSPLPRWDGTLLLMLGGCSASVKARNAAAAGADLLLLGDIGNRPEPPAMRGTSSLIPVFTVSREDVQALVVAGRSVQVVAEPPAVPIEQVAAGASRGPRLNDSALKPDLAAPGAIISAVAGGGTTVAPFGGSSGAAPVAAGTAALIVRELERRDLISAEPGLREPRSDSLTLAPLIKALIMNTTAPGLTMADGEAAPPTLIGSGRVDAEGAVRSRTIAVDTTEISALFASTTELTNCTVTPYRDLINYLFFGRTPPCAQEYPFGNDLMQAWNAQTGSVSFGYQPVSGTLTLQREVAVLNVGLSTRSYQLSVAAPTEPGVQISVSPTSLNLGPTSLEVVTLTLQLDAAALASRAAAPNGLDEVAGELLINGGAYNQLRVPWHVLPHRIADPQLARLTENQAILVNRAPAQPAVGDVFALVDLSPNQCDTAATCADVDYTPGAYPGLRYSPPDLAAVGVRGRSVPGLNDSFGLPPAPTGATPDELVEFALTLHDLPYRAAPYVPVGLEVTIDSDRNGSADFLLTTVNSGDGRVGLQLRDLNLADVDSGVRDVGYARAGFQTNSWILSVPAVAAGLRSDQPFAFQVAARDQYFSNQVYDCAPRTIAGCTTYYQFQTAAPAFVADQTSFTIPALSRVTLNYSEDPPGVLASPAQIGILVLITDTAPGDGAIPLRIR